MSLKDKLLNEGTITGGYPNNGIGGISSDDDLPPGTTVFGDKMVPVEVPNRLTGKTIKYVPAADVDQEWNYDEFDNSKSMGSHKSYSNTLKGLNRILGDRMWKHTDARKARMQQDKWDTRKDSEDTGGVTQTAKTGDDNLSHMELTKDGELDKIKGEKPASNDYWREVPMKHTKKLDIMERLNVFLGDDIVTEEVETINELDISFGDRKALSKAILSGKSSRIKIKSLNLEANIRNDDDQIEITYRKNDDFTLSLVELSDTLGYKFTTTSRGQIEEFTIYLD